MTERKRRLYRAVITAAPDGWVPLMLECSQLIGSGALISDTSEPIVWPELCAFCLEPVAGHTEAEAASCQIDLRSAA